MRVLIIILMSLSFAAHAQAQDVHGLVNKSLEYTYTNGASIKLNVTLDTLSFEWLTGPSKGRRGDDLKYNHSEPRENQHLINWNDPATQAFVTLLIDLDQKRVNGAALTSYKSENPAPFFYQATITNFSPLE